MNCHPRRKMYPLIRDSSVNPTNVPLRKRIATATNNNQHHIIALTETWLQKKQHYDAEVLDKLPNYRIFRSDRVTVQNPEKDDPAALASRGGCAILTSPDIIAESALSFSNKNCELEIVECSEFSLSIITVYRPAHSNFSLEKFREIIGKIDAYLSDNAAKPNGLDIILTGDFNFPANIVEWIPTDNGLKPNRKSGTCDEKIAFGMLNDLANQFNMEQLVDRPTRGTATLDLVFSNIPELFSSCSTISLAKVSDHDLIHFSVENSNIHQLPSQNAANQPEITKFNFLRANVPRVTQSLESTNWNIINANTLENANKLFVDAITQAASISGVPKYPNAQPGLPRLQ